MLLNLCYTLIATSRTINQCSDHFDKHYEGATLWRLSEDTCGKWKKGAEKTPLSRAVSHSIRFLFPPRSNRPRSAAAPKRIFHLKTISY